MIVAVQVLCGTSALWWLASGLRGVLHPKGRSVDYTEALGEVSPHTWLLWRERKWRSPFIAMHNRSYEHDSSAVNSCGDSKTI